MKFRLSRIVMPALLGAILAQTIYFHTNLASTLERSSWPWVMLALTVVCTGLAWLPARVIVRGLRQLPSPPVAATYVGIMLVIAWLLTYALPVPVAPQLKSTLTVQATGEHHPDAIASEVWVRLEVDGRRIPPSEWRSDGQWQQRGDLLLSTPARQPASVKWRGRVRSSAVLTFVSTRWSGKAAITWNGKTNAVDLYESDAQRSSRSIDLRAAQTPSPFLTYPDRSPLERWAQVCDAGSIAILLLLVILALSMAPASHGLGASQHLLRDVLLFSAPMMTVSFIMLLIFYPGIMTSDSLDQWHQGTMGRYHDWHPAYHSMAMAGLRHLWDSPALIAGLQALALASSTGWLIASIRMATRCTRAAACVASWLCALCPFIAVTSVTLWKDVPYAATIVATTAACISLVYAGTPRLKRPAIFFAAWCVATAAMLLRHNAPPVVLLAIIVTAMLARPMRAPLLLLAVTSMVGFALLAGPVSNALGIVHTNVKYSLAAHHVAAHLSLNEEPATTGERDLVARIDSSDPAWHYACNTVDRTIFNKQFHASIASANADELVKTSIELAFAHPKTELEHIACVSALVWSMNGAPVTAGPMYISTIGIANEQGSITWIRENKDGLHEDSLLPAVAQHVGAWLLKQNQKYWWRPGAYLWLLALATMVAIARLRDIRIALAVLVTPLAHTAILAIINVAQDARYQLPVFVIALAVTPGLIRAWRPAPAGSPTDAS